MKKKYYLLALSALIMAGCSDENDPFAPGGGGTEGTGKSITFVFPGVAQGVVPYSAAASAAENELKTLDIYVFGEDTLAGVAPQKLVLEEIFKGGGADGNFTFVQNGTDIQAKISYNPGNRKKFYFVANGRDQLSLSQDVELGKTDTVAFLAKATNVLKGHILCPLLMSGTYPTSGELLPADQAADQNYNVVLERRMARFDVLNRSEESGFKVLEVLLKNAPAANRIFPSQVAYTPALGVDPAIIDFTALANNNYGETNSVFYMYPAPASLTDDIELALIGQTLAGQPQVYNVEFKKQQKDTEYIPVLANNRYLLSILNVGTAYLDARLEVTEWVVGDTVNVNAGHGTIKLTVPTLGSALGFANNTLSMPAEPLAAADSVTIQVAADEEWELVYDRNEIDWVAVTPLPGDSVLRSFRLTTTGANPSSQEARTATILVQNVKRPAIKQPLIISQAAQDPATGRFINVSGALMSGTDLHLLGSKTDAVEIAIDVPDAAVWNVTPSSNPAPWLTLDDVVVTRAATKAATRVATKAVTEKTGDGSFTVKATANTSLTEGRVDTVFITIAGVDQVNLVQKVIVRQAPKELGSINIAIRGGALNVTDGFYYVNKIPVAGFPEKAADHLPIVIAGDGKRKVSVTATSEWEQVVDTEGQTWLTVSDRSLTSGESGQFFVTASENTGVARKGTITVRNTTNPDDIKQTIVFKQDAAPGASISAGAIADFAADADATAPVSINVTVAEETDVWTATMKDGNTDFVITEVGGTGNGAFKIAPAAANTTNAAKTATVVLTNTTKNDKKEIAVKQLGLSLPDITVDETALSFLQTDEAANTQTIAVALGNPANTWSAALTEGTAFTLGGNVADVTGDGSFTVAPNAANATYKAVADVITVTEAAGSATKTIAVSQAGLTAPTFAVTDGAVASDGTGLTPTTFAVSGDVVAEANWTVEVMDAADGGNPVAWVTASLTSAAELTVAMATDGTEANADVERKAYIKLVNTTDGTVVSNPIVITQAAVAP